MLKIDRFTKNLYFLAFLFTAALAFQNCDRHLPNGSKADASNATLELVQLNKAYLQADNSNKSEIKSDIVQKADERRAILLDLMKSNPEEVIRVAIPEEKTVGMPDEALKKIEKHRQLNGQLEVYYEDREDGSHKLRNYLKTEHGKRFELHFAGETPELMNNNEATVSGVVLEAENAPDASSDGHIALTNETIVLAAYSSGTPPAGAYTFGEQVVIVVNVNFLDNTSEPWTPEASNTVVFGSANDFIKENSFGQTWLTGKVTPWLNLPINSADCDTTAIMTAAVDEATKQGYYSSTYHRLIVAMPYSTACPFSGVAGVGGYKSTMLINGSMKMYTVAHEMGHNLGLFHSHALECGADIIGSSCSTDEYGDGVDMMGRYAVQYSSYQKERLGWIDSSNILTVTENGSFEIEPYARPQGASPKVLKVAKGVDSTSGQLAWYYVEYRGAYGQDSNLSSNTNVQNGVVIHTGIENKGNSSFLLDMTPNSYASSYADTRDPALEVGNSFTDPNAGITFTTNSVNGSTAQVSIQLAGTTPSCSRANPSLSINPGESAWVEAGTVVSYKLTLTSHDSSLCSSYSYSLSAVAPTGWTSNLGSSALTLAPGESRSTTLTITSPSSTVDGFYTINVAANSGSYNANSSVTYVVDNPTVIVNSPPVANNDSTSTNEDTSVIINVLANDSDPDGDPLSVSSVSGVNGSALINSNNTITFAPALNFVGIEVFTYVISDGKGGSATASVSVSVKDVTSPTAVLTSPTNGSTLSGLVSIQASASDNASVSKVDFLIDGSLLSSDISPAYSASLDTNKLANGSHKISAQAIDSSGNKSAVYEITVNVDNVIEPPQDTMAPNVAVTSPVDGDLISPRTTITITASATDNIKMNRVEFYVNETLVCSDTTAAYSCSYKLPGAKGASYNILAKAYDSSGNYSQHQINIVSSGSGGATSGGGKGGGKGRTK